MMTNDTKSRARALGMRRGLALRVSCAALLLLATSACRSETAGDGMAQADAESEASGEFTDENPSASGDIGAGAQAEPEADLEKTYNDPVFDAERLQQMVSPVALYPDSLVTQVLIAATYPLEVVEADRWVKDNPKVQGKELDSALAAENWDESVKSLVRFPDVLSQMSNNLDWTRDLGDAFLAQKSDVLNAVQTMRLSACDAGKLASTPQQKVIIEPIPAPTGDASGVVPQPRRIVRIVPADPQVVYVPQYSPAVVFGPPPVLYYPVYNAYPPNYVSSTAVISFGLGLAVGAILWNDTDWYHHRVYSRHRDGGYRGHDYRDDYRDRGDRDSYRYSGSGNVIWQHDVSHRRGESYRSSIVTRQYRPDGHDARDNRDYRHSNGRGPVSTPPGREHAPGPRWDREHIDENRSDHRPPTQRPSMSPGSKGPDHGARSAAPDKHSPAGPSMGKPRTGQPSQRPGGGGSSMEKPRSGGGSSSSRPPSGKSHASSPSSSKHDPAKSGHGGGSKPDKNGGGSRSDKGSGGDKRKGDQKQDAGKGGGHSR